MQRLNTVLLYGGNASKEVNIFITCSSPEVHVLDIQM